MSSITLEICCGSASDCCSAQKGGADRIELNSALELGGLTPTVGELRAARVMCDLPIMAMLRPRAGGFCYSYREFDSMLEDAYALLKEGVNGIVFGCLTENGEINATRTELLCIAAKKYGAQAVFHRAIDVCADWRVAFEVLKRAGVDRVLTSGRARTAREGASVIAEMVRRAEGALEILPGSGVNEENVTQLLRDTGCTQAHLSARRAMADTSCAANSALNFGALPDNGYYATDADAVRRVREKLDEYAAV